MAGENRLVSGVLLVCLIALGMSLPVRAAEQTGLEAGMVNPGYQEKPAWFKESFLDFQEDIAEAKSKGKRLILYFYQDGCPYCAKLLHDNFGQPRIVEKTRRYFDLIAINMWGDRDVTWLDGIVQTEKEFAARMKVMFTPTMLFFNEQGDVVLRVNGYYNPDRFNTALDYVGTHQESKLSFSEYYKKSHEVKQTASLSAEPFLQKPPYHLQRLLQKSDKPLLLIFEELPCAACDELRNDIYRRDETLAQLKRFNVVRLNMWAETKLIDFAGKQTTARELAKRLRVQYAPSLVFFDHRGKEVMRTEAYLKAFHLQSVMDYVASGAYRKQPNFQRFIAGRAEQLEQQGVHVDLMK